MRQGPAQERLQHGGGRVQVGYHPVAQRMDNLDVLGLLPGQGVRGLARRGHPAGCPVNRYRRGLFEDEPAAGDADERIDRAEIDRYTRPQPHVTRP